LPTSDGSSSLQSSGIPEIASTIAILSSVKDNGTAKEQLLALSLIIQGKYPHYTLNLLKSLIIDGIAQEFNQTNIAQTNDVFNLMFWLRKYALENPTKEDKEKEMKKRFKDRGF